MCVYVGVGVNIVMSYMFVYVVFKGKSPCLQNTLHSNIDISEYLLYFIIKNVNNAYCWESF